MMSGLVAVMAVVAVIGAVVQGKELDDYVSPCKAGDANLNACVKDAANALIPIMAGGIPELGIPSLDPLLTSTLELVEDTQYVSIDLKYIDITQTGLSKMVVDDVEIDLANGAWKFKLFQPVFSIVGKYKSKGTILEMTIDGEGSFNSTHLNTKIDLIIGVSRVPRNGDEFFQLNKFQLIYTFGTAMMEYDGLFNGDAAMEKSTNQFLNEHSHEILTDLKPALEKVYGDLFEVHLRKFLDSVSAKRLFP